jgi:outer membrane lipoprotein-sorting protein
MEYAMKRFVKRIMLAAIVGGVCVPVLTAVQMADVISNARVKYGNGERNLRDITITQEIRLINPEKAPETEMNVTRMKIYRKRACFRIETEIMATDESGGQKRAMTNVVLYDGRDAWMISPMFVKSKLSKEETRQFESQTSWWWNSLGPKAVLHGTETVEGKDCYLIDNTNDRSALIKRLWIDKNTFHLLQSEVWGNGGAKEATIMVFTDYRKVDNSPDMPFNIRVFSRGILLSVTTIKEVVVNTGLPDSLFSVSEKVTTP